jgi:hypothetical protein
LLDGPLEAQGLVLLQRLEFVEALQEEQVGDLLDHLERIADAARPEGIPDAVDLLLDDAGDHVRGFCFARRPPSYQC